MIDNSECLIGFGNFIKEGREKRSLLQSEVAESLHITQSYYSCIESGKRNVDLVLAMKICEVLHLNMHEYIRTYLN